MSTKLKAINAANENYVGIHVCGAQLGLHVSGLDKPVRTVGRGIKRMFGISRASINAAAKGIAARTE